MRARCGASQLPVPPHPMRCMVMLLITGSRIERAYRASLFSASSFVEEASRVDNFFGYDLEVFFDVCFVINYFSFAVVGIPNFFG